MCLERENIQQKSRKKEKACLEQRRNSVLSFTVSFLGSVNSFSLVHLLESPPHPNHPSPNSIDIDPPDSQKTVASYPPLLSARSSLLPSLLSAIFLHLCSVSDVKFKPPLSQLQKSPKGTTQPRRIWTSRLENTIKELEPLVWAGHRGSTPGLS